MKKSQDHGPRNKKITLNREIIARLTVSELERARGGHQDPDPTSLASCQETNPVCVTL
jgi:hypothetical protein